MNTRITVAATEKEWRALLALIPRCIECGALAEVMLNARPRCVPCAGRHRRGRCETPAWADIALRIHDAVGGTP